MLIELFLEQQNAVLLSPGPFTIQSLGQIRIVTVPQHPGEMEYLAHLKQCLIRGYFYFVFSLASLSNPRFVYPALPYFVHAHLLACSFSCDTVLSQRWSLCAGAPITTTLFEKLQKGAVKKIALKDTLQFPSSRHVIFRWWTSVSTTPSMSTDYGWTAPDTVVTETTSCSGSTYITFSSDRFGYGSCFGKLVHSELIITA